MILAEGLFLAITIGCIFAALHVPITKPINATNNLRQSQRIAQKYNATLNDGTSTENDKNLTAMTQPLEDDRNMAWLGEIVIGTGKTQKFLVQFDTGSSWLLLSCAGVNDSKCTDQFACSTSSTCVDAKMSFYQLYGGGDSMSGNMMTDRVCFTSPTTGFCTQTDFEFGCATKSSGICDDFTGILGMAWPGNSSQRKQPSMLYSLFSQRSICPSAMVSFWLNNLNGHYQGDWQNDQYGEVTICGIDHRRYTPPIHYVPLSNNQSVFWQISLSKITVGDELIANSDIEDAILDTGTSLLAVPEKWYKKIMDRINASIEDQLVRSDGTLPCNAINALAKITFTISDTEFVLEPHDYMIPLNCGEMTNCCVFGIVAIQQPFFIFGDVFIGRYYTIFDHENARLGFAASVGRS